MIHSPEPMVSPIPTPDPDTTSTTTTTTTTTATSTSRAPTRSARRSASASASASAAASSDPAAPSDTPRPTEQPPAPVATEPTGPGSAPPGAPTPDPVTTQAVQTALGAEHAAVWCYGLAQAFLPATLDAQARQDLAGHRARRDATVRLLSDYGVPPAAAQPAYRPPQAVTDQTSAMRLLVAAESDAAAAWRSVLESCDDQGLRRMALDGLTEAAARGGRWSEQLGLKPVVPAFPGRD